MKKTVPSTPKTSAKTIKQSVIFKENAYLTWGMFIVFLICVFSVTTHKLEDDDVFWHLSTGKFITENGFIPDKDVFGLATQNAEWIPFEWGSDLLFYNVHKIIGLNGIFIFTSVLLGIFFLLLFRLLQKLKVNPVITTILFFFFADSFF